MDKQLVKQFYDQTQLRDEVFKYLRAAMDEMLLKDGYEGKETKGYSLALEVLVRAQSKMRTEFEVKNTQQKPPRAL